MPAWAVHLRSPSVARVMSAQLPLHFEIVFDGKDARHSVRLNVSNVLVSFVGDDPFKSHVAIFHDDMNGGTDRML